MPDPDLTTRLEAGAVICAQGYLFELERRGYLQAGAFVPEVVLDHPEVVQRLHRDFVHAGSDVVEALTYYAHRGQMRLVGREADVESINRQALALAREVAVESGMLLAGDICNTNVYDPADERACTGARAMFDEQVGWAMDAGADFVIGETFAWFGEARLALEAIVAAGGRAVVTLAVPRGGRLWDGVDPVEACQRLEQGGATVVGLNCARGPATMWPLIERIRGGVSCHVAALPVPYRTTEAQPVFQDLTDPAATCLPGGRPFPTALDPLRCNRYEVGAFAGRAFDAGVRYLGVCCGGGPHDVWAIANALGRRTGASRYAADMSRHAYFHTAPGEERRGEHAERAQREGGGG